MQARGRVAPEAQQQPWGRARVCVPTPSGRTTALPPPDRVSHTHRPSQDHDGQSRRTRPPLNIQDLPAGRVSSAPDLKMKATEARQDGAAHSFGLSCNTLRWGCLRGRSESMPPVTLTKARRSLSDVAGSWSTLYTGQTRGDGAQVWSDNWVKDRRDRTWKCLTMPISWSTG